MKCPHCLNGIHSHKNTIKLGIDKEGTWMAKVENCPECKKLIIEHVLIVDGYIKKTILTHPKGVSRTPVSKDVPDQFADDYKEACLVFSDSAKASAALSRRCLQNILRDKAGVKPGNLADEIQQTLDSKQLPSWLAESLDAIRNIGNFAAHPMKSTHSGEILEVEPGEAEWNLDVLEGLFDFYFVQPAILKKKQDDLNKKLKDAGKPPMKSP